MKLNYIIKSDDDKLSIKSIIKREFKLSTRLLNKLKTTGRVLINNQTAFVNNSAKIGDLITLDFDYDEEDYIIPQKFALEILFEDDFYLAVNKPAGVVVHPSCYHPDNTLANYVKYYLNNKKKIRPVNRLDNGTSGIVLFAKNEYAQELFKQLEIEPIKKYIAFVLGKMDNIEGSIDAPISRKADSIIEREVNINGQNAITNYKVLEELLIDGLQISKLEVSLKTGRTHQIRVHMAHIGHPIIGDSLYNKVEPKLNDLIARQALHAYMLEFFHPITHELIHIESELPKDINHLIEIKSNFEVLK